MWQGGGPQVKRIAVELGLFLLLGAILNVAIAWGLVLFCFPHHFVCRTSPTVFVPNTEEDVRLWSCHATAMWPEIPPYHFECSHLGLRSWRFKSLYLIITGMQGPEERQRSNDLMN